MHSSASTERQSSGECSGIPKLRTGSDSSNGSKKSNLKQPGKTPIRSTTIMSQQTPTGMTPRAGRFNFDLPTGPLGRSPSAERCSTLGSQKIFKKDTRNLTNKSTQEAMLNRIDYFLETYPSSSVLNKNNSSFKPIILNSVVTETELLFQHLDITTKQQLTQANYIDELPKYAKKIHYPGNMSKSANTPHLYPHIVGSPCGPYEIDGDEPVDYSQQYLEKNQLKTEKNIEVQLQNDDKYFPKDNQNIFGDYTETDLDQPTDYSLRYVEDDTDGDEKQIPQYFTPTEQEDTVKTYCTEGTPYETPFNFSNATSMSDLHLDETKDSESLDNKNDAEVIELPEDLIHKKDKPINKEDTEETVGTSNEQSPQKQNDKEGKVVTFGSEDHYAEETPLMFSRSSSFSSLSELEQISINEDRSSIISDFSRRTSGVVSPSELPDSPCQTVPPSPRYKNSIDYSFRNNARSPDGVHVYCTEDTPANTSPAGSQSNLSALSMPSIIEDFEKPNDESETRNNLSDSSDSSILFDDDDDDDDKILDECIQSGMPKRSSPFRTLSLVVNISFDDSPNQSDDDDDDDDAILAKCIESGMPKSTILSTNPSPSTSRSIDTTKNNLKSEQTKSLGSEDSLSLSNDEEDLILEQCIRSGMSKMNVKNIKHG